MITFSIGVRHKQQGFRFEPPVYEYFADPFVLEVTGDVVEIVFECYHRFSRKADIQLLTVDFLTCTAKRTSLIVEPYHLSYPFVVRHSGRVYLLPESVGASVQKIYLLGRNGNGWEARPICEAPGRFIDPTVACLSPEGNGILRYYTGASNHDGELHECAIRFKGESVLLGAVSNKVGRHRPGGWWDNNVFPMQRAGTRYGFGLAFTDRADRPVPPPAQLPEAILKDLWRMHHLSLYGGAMTFDICADVSYKTLMSRRHFFEVE